MVRPIVARVVTVADMAQLAALLPERFDLACDPATGTFRICEVVDGDLVPLEEQ